MNEEKKLQAKNDETGSVPPPVASVVKKRPASNEHPVGFAWQASARLGSPRME